MCISFGILSLAKTLENVMKKGWFWNIPASRTRILAVGIITGVCLSVREAHWQNSAVRLDLAGYVPKGDAPLHDKP